MNQLSSLYQNPLHLFDMNFGEISVQMQRCPSLIVPIGSMEPIGLYGVTGIISRCSKVISEALSSKLRVLTAPQLYYSCSTAFKSFEGCAGMRGRTLTNMITEICRDWIFQGFQRILLLNVSSENDSALEQATKRLNDRSEKVKYFSLQSDARIIEQVFRYKTGQELGRSEYLIIWLAQYLFADLLCDGPKGQYPLPETKQFQNWKKRGKDPEMFRKMFPLGSTSEISVQKDVDFGRDLFEFIIMILEKDYTPFLIVPEDAA